MDQILIKWLLTAVVDSVNLVFNSLVGFHENLAAKYCKSEIVLLVLKCAVLGLSSMVTRNR